jgi:hypothetical protein
MSVVYEMTSHQASVFTSKSREWRLGRARRSSKLVPFSGDRCNGLYARQRLWGLDNMERVLDEYQYLIDYKSVVLAYSTVSARTILCLANTEATTLLSDAYSMQLRPDAGSGFAAAYLILHEQADPTRV